MFVEKRKTKDGKVWFSFSYDDPVTKKRVRLKKSEHGHFDTYEKAKAWADSQAAQRAARLDLLKRKEEWRNTYYDFSQLVDRFLAYVRNDKMSRSANAVETYFVDYALRFFLDIKKASNPNNWYLLFADLRTWLKSEAKTLKGAPLAPSSRNHVILSVNNFLAFLGENNLIDPDSVRKCKNFEKQAVKEKSAANVVTESEFKVMLPRLRAINPDAADLFNLLFRSGMRINEAISLPMTSLFDGKIQHKALADELDGLRGAEAHKLAEYHGYILLSSQAADRSLQRVNGHIARAPLKSRKKISPKNSRIIPIWDKGLWNMLVDRHERQQKEQSKRRYGDNPEDYLLFDGLALSTFTAQLTRAYRDTEYMIKTPHDLRHSFATNFCGLTRSFFLARLILGHRKESIFDDYLHLYDQITRTASVNIKRLKRVD